MKTVTVNSWTSLSKVDNFRKLIVLILRSFFPFILRAYLDPRRYLPHLPGDFGEYEIYTLTSKKHCKIIKVSIIFSLHVL